MFSLIQGFCHVLAHMKTHHCGFVLHIGWFELLLYIKSIVSRGNQNYFICCVFGNLVIFGFLNKILMKRDTEGPYLAVSTAVFVLSAVGCAKTNCIYKTA